MSEEVLSGRYRIVRHLARGGMAEVYLAHDELLDRPVAVKVMLAEFAQDESFIERFRREATSAAGLAHPNIVSVYDFGEDDSSYFIVMEYVEGETLGEIIHRSGAMEPSRAIGIAADIAAALAAAHKRGIIHRDMKPDNVLMAGGVAKVADFGIARASSAREDLTLPGSVIGTPTYLSPEQAQGRPVDQRSDLYSLGMVLYEMLAGRPPFKGDSAVSVAYQQTSLTPPPPSTYNPSVPPELDAVVAKATAKDPAHRHVSADELRAELLAVGRGPAGTPTVVSGLPASSALPGAARDPTTLMAPPPGGGGRPVPPAPPGREPQAVYRRRRTVVLGLLLILLLGGIAVVAVLARGGTKATATATVPKVDGLSVSDAIAAVSKAHLKSQVVGVQPGAPDLVATQDPQPGSIVSRSTTVTLVVASPTTTTIRPRPSTIPSTRATTTTTSPAPTTVAPPTTVPPTTTATVTTTNTPPTT